MNGIIRNNPTVPQYGQLFDYVSNVSADGVVEEHGLYLDAKPYDGRGARLTHVLHRTYDEVSLMPIAPHSTRCFKPDPATADLLDEGTTVMAQAFSRTSTLGADDGIVHSLHGNICDIDRYVRNSPNCMRRVRREERPSIGITFQNNGNADTPFWFLRGAVCVALVKALESLGVSTSLALLTRNTDSRTLAAYSAKDAYSQTEAVKHIHNSPLESCRRVLASTTFLKLPGEPLNLPSLVPFLLRDKSLESVSFPTRESSYLQRKESRVKDTLLHRAWFSTQYGFHDGFFSWEENRPESLVGDVHFGHCTYRGVQSFVNALAPLMMVLKPDSGARPFVIQDYVPSRWQEIIESLYRKDLGFDEYDRQAEIRDMESVIQHGGAA